LPAIKQRSKKLSGHLYSRRFSLPYRTFSPESHPFFNFATHRRYFRKRTTSLRTKSLRQIFEMADSSPAANGNSLLETTKTSECHLALLAHRYAARGDFG
jgi:hypothetical protein